MVIAKLTKVKQGVLFSSCTYYSGLRIIFNASQKETDQYSTTNYQNHHKEQHVYDKQNLYSHSSSLAVVYSIFLNLTPCSRQPDILTCSAVYGSCQESFGQGCKNLEIGSPASWWDVIAIVGWEIPGYLQGPSNA